MQGVGGKGFGAITASPAEQNRQTVWITKSGDCLQTKITFINSTLQKFADQSFFSPVSSCHPHTKNGKRHVQN